jgi:hypothetical protein
MYRCLMLPSPLPIPFSLASSLFPPPLQAADLVSRSLGPLILRELGSTYKRAAREFLGK